MARFGRAQPDSPPTKFDFREVRFHDADLNRAEFCGELDLACAQFNGRTMFVKAQFLENVHWEGTRFSGASYFDRAEFKGYANLAEAVFVGEDHDLGGALLSRVADVTLPDGYHLVWSAPRMQWVVQRIVAEEIDEKEIDKGAYGP